MHDEMVSQAGGPTRLRSGRFGVKQTRRPELRPVKAPQLNSAQPSRGYSTGPHCIPLGRCAIEVRRRTSIRASRTQSLETGEMPNEPRREAVEKRSVRPRASCLPTSLRSRLYRHNSDSLSE